MADQAFWQTKSLAEMSDTEWESLCDGCARCCLVKLESWDTAEVFYTSVVCRYLDQDHCRCSDYQNRTRLVPSCIEVSPKVAAETSWLPATCAYRMLAEGKELAWWHPLVSGRADSVHEAGISVRGKVVSEAYVHPDDAESRIIRWVET